jgi:AcrR family transcriptional regulator
MSPAIQSRREQQRSETVRALQAAALELCVEQGYDNTTTDEIAARAGVSSRTFFRHFPSKESVLFVGDEDWFESFAQLLLAEPEAVDDLDAIRRTFMAMAPGPDKRHALLQYERAVASSLPLRGGIVDRSRAGAAILAVAIARRRGLRSPDDGCELLAAIAMAAYRHAIQQWLADAADRGASDVLDATFRTLRSLLQS